LNGETWYLTGEGITEGQNIQAGNTTYPSVAVYTADTLAYPQLKIWKVMIARDAGIVKYFERQPYKEWEKM
jgi:hypothetical protein